MPGGYANPFLNPRGQPPSAKKCQNYNHSQPGFLSVPASVNVTGGPLSVNPITPTGGSPTLVSPRPYTGGSLVGAPSIDDANYFQGQWPQIWSDSNGTTHIRFPENDFVSAGTVNLSGLCRQVGFQNAQFQRQWHGMYGFDCEANGLTCTAGVYSKVKYRKFKVNSYLTQALAWSTSSTTTRDSDGVVTDSQGGTYSVSGSQYYAFTMEVDEDLGVLTISGCQDVDNTSNPNNYDFVEVHNGVTTNPAPVNPSHVGFGDAKADSNNDGSTAISYDPCTELWTGFGASGVTQSALTTQIMNNFADGAPFCNTPIANPFSDIPCNNFIITGVAYTTTATTLIVEISYGAGPDQYSSVDYSGSTNVRTQHNSGTATLHIEFDLSEEWTADQVKSDIDSVFGTGLMCDFNDRIKHPLRTDGYLTVAPLYMRREQPNPISPQIFPSSITSVWDASLMPPAMTSQVNGGFSVDNLLAAGGQIPWFDGVGNGGNGSYVWHYPISGASPATALVLLYDGAWLDAMQPAGTGAGTVTDGTTQAQGCFSFTAESYTHEPDTPPGDCSQVAWGAFASTNVCTEALPPWCQSWTDPQMAAALWPCEFVAYSVPVAPTISLDGYAVAPDTIFVQRYQEAKIRITQMNVCRPYGADKIATNYNSPGVSCNGSGQLQRSGAPLALAWPKCPGLTFVDDPMVGGRVRVLSVDGSGIANVFPAQPYFCTPSGENVNVYDQNMTLLGTAAATLGADDSHFAGFGAYPTAFWITPVYRNDGSTPWVYSDCDDYPKGHWVSEAYTVDTDAGSPLTVLSSAAALQCAIYNDECGAPTMLRTVAGAPAAGRQATLAVVRQFDIDPFWQQPLYCNGTVVTAIAWNPGDCTTLPVFVESFSTTPITTPIGPGVAGCPGQAGFDQGAILCGPAQYTNYPWLFYLACPASFPL